MIETNIHLRLFVLNFLLRAILELGLNLDGLRSELIMRIVRIAGLSPTIYKSLNFL